MSKYDCPICGQYMDFIVTSHRNKPFVDGKCYPKMCFACFHVPLDYITTYDEQGNIAETSGPFFSHRHLNSAEDLLKNGSVNSLREAQNSVDAVKRSCREVGARNLDKLKITRPSPDYELNFEHEKKQIEMYKRRVQNRSSRKSKN